MSNQRETPTNRTTRRLATGAAVLGAGVLLAGPITAFAQQDDDEPTTTTATTDEEVERGPGGFISDVLAPLVADGTLTQAQADAVTDAIEAARPERPPGGFGGHGHWGRGPFGHVGLDAAAEALGLEEDDIADALRDGTTLAELAQQQGVEVQAVIDALVAEASQRIDEGVEDGRLDADEAADRLAEITERITEMVNEGGPRFERRTRADEPSTDEPSAPTIDEPAPTTTTG